MLWWIFPFVLWVAWMMTGQIRQYALRHLLDIPNARSSHNRVTPRGGGLAIVLTFFAALVVASFADVISWDSTGLLLWTLVVAGVGFWDDHQHIPARWRFLVHILVALILVLLLQGIPSLQLGGRTFELGVLGYPVAVLILVWWLNLFNFMDGIDGIAASEAIFMASALAIFGYFVDKQLAFIALLLAFSCAGFLLWNWPPAKIFMGDVGSVFLGMVLGVLILMAGHKMPVLLVVGVILAAVFVVDATYTLLYRLLTAQKWYDAHCSHAYQQAAKRYGHLSVLAVVWLVNVCWLLPLAVLAFRFPAIAGWVLLCAYVPLLYIVIRFNAGVQK